MKKAILMSLLAVAGAFGAKAQMNFIVVTNNSPHTLSVRLYGDIPPTCTPNYRTISYPATSPGAPLYASSATWIGTTAPAQYFNRVRIFVPGSSPLQYTDLSLCSPIGDYELELSNSGPHIRVDIGDNNIVINNND